ncbi:MAG: hypothetical protein H7246_21070 [Phycisphaerae bacterium]|nr:hypothetical protein [Saprospiraceae bacterium]
MSTRLKMLFISTLFSFSLNLLFGQTFETTIGEPSKNEFAYDGKPLPVAKCFVTVSNAPIFSPKNQWLFTRIDPTGHHIVNKVYGESNNIQTKVLEGRAIERVFGDGKGVYQAGGRTHAQPVRAVLMFSDDTGTPIHAMQQYSPANVGEMATTLESVSDGVIVAGNAKYNSLQVTNNRFFVARFKLTNNKLVKTWSNRYFDGDVDSLKANFTVGKTCMGTSGNNPVIVITGSYVKKGTSGTHSFISCINANTGSELWRRYVQSGFKTDEGADIVQDPATKNFMMIGYCINTAGKRCLYVAYLNQSGTFLTGGSYSTVFGNSEIVGQDVTLSNDGKSAVITGYVKLPENNLKPNAFFVEIPFVPTPDLLPLANTNYAKFYTASEAYTRGTSSIDRNEGANDTKGYFITTQSVAPNAAAPIYNIHVIDVENDGETHLGPPCFVKKFELKPQKSGKEKKPFIKKEATNWDDIKVIEKVITLPEERCQ